MNTAEERQRSQQKSADTDARRRPKGPLNKSGAATVPTTSWNSTTTVETPSVARGALAFGAPPQPTTKKSSGSVSKFDSRQERSPFLDASYMEQRARALGAMRHGAGSG